MKPKLLIFTVAMGKYRVYTDLFTYLVNKAYPEYEVSVLNADEDLQFSKEFLQDHPWFASCLRFTWDPSCGEYKNVYITDVDMMICPETPSLLDFHRAEMRETGLYYSNVPRWREPMGENRMTGLHFVGSQWWIASELAREHERQRLFCGEIGDCKCDDELMLMRIIKNSGLPVTQTSNLLRRHHGIHLGTLRDYRGETLQKRRGAVYSRIRPHAGYWRELIETEDYKKLFAEIRRQDKDAEWELKELEKFVRQLAKEQK